MNKKKVGKYIPEALIAIDVCGLAHEGCVAKEYKAYISSFGASIIQSGLLPAVAFFENRVSGAQQDRSKLMKALLYIIAEDKRKEIKSGNSEHLLDYIIARQDKISELKEEIMTAAIALKLALRTFKFTGETGGEDDGGA